MKAPKPQEYLTKEGKQVYKELTRILEAYDALEEIDSYGLSILADALDTYQVASEKVKELGHVQTYKTGATAPSAWMNVKKQSYEMFLKLSAKYGLSNKDRETMLKFKAKKDEGDKLDDI